MNNLKIIKCKNCDSGYCHLYLNDVLITEGDYYHNKISSFIVTNL